MNDILKELEKVKTDENTVLYKEDKQGGKIVIIRNDGMVQKFLYNQDEGYTPMPADRNVPIGGYTVYHKRDD
ncbi:MAG: hypothetical protein M0R32_06405 [Candidatus Cloacimonetes bacterium]|jgi:hypothetical protein|nr:hypothetical protein [Candidatus Cloacimonadota bacterium]